MSKELVAKLRSGFITDACGVPLRGSTEKVMNEAADLLEQQAKELAEAQARVVVLKRLLNSAGVALNAWHIKYGEFRPEWLPPAGQVKLIEEITEALATTDTAANHGKDAVDRWEFFTDHVGVMREEQAQLFLICSTLARNSGVPWHMIDECGTPAALLDETIRAAIGEKK